MIVCKTGIKHGFVRRNLGTAWLNSACVLKIVPAKEEKFIKTILDNVVLKSFFL